MSPSIAESALRLALPFAVGTGYWLVGGLHRDPAVAAEARYLGLLVTVVLLCAAWVTPRLGAAFSALAVLLAALPWALPGTADRGAAAGMLLGLALVAGVLSRRPDTWSARSVVALSLGAQLLLLGPRLLSPTPSSVIAIVGWAALAGVSLEVLRHRCGGLPAALAAATAFVLGPGFGPWSALALAGPAAAAVAADGAASRLLRALAATALVLPLAWDPERGLLLLVCAAVVAGRGRLAWIAGAAGLVALVLPEASLAAAPSGLLWALLLLPALTLRPWVEADLRLPALVLLLATAAHSSDRTLLALPMVTLALGAAPRYPVSLRLQAGWSAALAAMTALLAAYPWLRQDPLVETLALLGGGAQWVTTAVVALVAIAATAADRLPHAEVFSRRTAAWILAALLGAAALASHPATAWLGIAGEPVVLGADSAAWRRRLESSSRVGSVALDSTLSHAASLPPGTVVASLHLETSGGETVLPVRTGIESGEWAARRADVAALPTVAAPAPFLGWVAAGGEFFGQRYRGRWELPARQTIEGLQIRLAPDLPPELTVTLFHLELRR